MESSRHERAMVVVASYVIGFTSAFIAYGINQLPASDIVVVDVADSVQSESVKPRVGQSYTASVRIEPDGLVVVSEAGNRLLSARKSSPFLANVVSAGPQPGFAVQIVEAELSRDSRFVYFCEQLTDESQNCVAYVYDIEGDILHPLTVRGVDYQPQISTHTSAWSADGRLTVDGFTSGAAAAPWLLQ